MELFPTIIGVYDDSRYIHDPLRLAIRYQSSAAVILKMVELYPMVVEIRDTNGLYPLHLVLDRNYPETVVSKLIQLFPTAVGVCYQKGHYPLHVAINHKQSEAIILTMLDIYPEAIQEDDEDKRKKLLRSASKCSKTVLYKTSQIISNKRLKTTNDT